MQLSIWVTKFQEHDLAALAFRCSYNQLSSNLLRERDLNTIAHPYPEAVIHLNSLKLCFLCLFSRHFKIKEYDASLFANVEELSKH